MVQSGGGECGGDNMVNTTACKRLSSLGCVAHTDGAVSQGAPEFIGFSELLLDGRGFAAGGISLISNLGTNIGPRIFVTGYSEHGISVQTGHEVMIHETWVCPW